MRFKVGDKIIMNRKASEWYGITKKGSIGTIIAINRDSSEPYQITFSKLTGSSSRDEKTFWISETTFDLLEPVDPKQAVIKKIKEMDSRRKEMGYAF